MDCGIILAAGLSSRMGRSKPLLPLKKTTVIENLLFVMREAGLESIVVVTGYMHGEVAEQIKAHWDTKVEFFTACKNRRFEK